MEIKDVFGAQPKSVWEYLCENGQGLYIPAYQRQYSWDRQKQIKRLFEDACHGFTQLIEREDSITFLGTLITIHDTQLVTVHPIVKGDVPAKVMTVIDGQQRLTTFLLMSTVLHEDIKLRMRKLESTPPIDDKWLEKECKKIISRLTKTFEEDMSYGDDAFQYYPKMIRAYVDSWSRDKGKASYASPIGSYLHEYGKYARDEHKKPFKYNYPDGKTDSANHKFLSESKEFIKKIIRSISEDSDKELEVPTLQDICKAERFQNTLTKAEFPTEVKDILLNSDNSPYKELVRLVLFGNFYLDRIAITIVTAKNEDYAFDMFEALNTTGEPLTAFETFKPRIIATESLSLFEKSPSREFIIPVENYLESFIRTSDKQDATSQLIVSFALAERGEKLSKRLSDQRRFLKEKYEQFEAIEEKRDFIRHLSHAAIFIQNAWSDDKQVKPKLPFAEQAERDDVLLCLDFLRQSNHSITLGPLIRFYSEIRRADSFDRDDAILAFIEAVKAITAFSVLWRSSRRGTENIDAIYRELMKDGEANVFGMKPLSRRPNGIATEKLNVKKLKAALVYMLKNKGNISCKDDWLKMAVSLPAYSNQMHVTRFILLAAAHNSVEDKDNPGLTVKAKEGTLPLLTYEAWKSDIANTIEHIAPQKQANGWSEKIYENPENIEKLGNLTLLPGKENSSLNNRTWKHKRLIYQILSAPTVDDLEQLLTQAKEEGIELSQSTAELLNGAKYLPLVKALTNVTTEWNLEIIESRSECIAEIAWDRIAPWLELS
ncbi:MAG: DUF262 domain-containing HNH endonuclease family protein [Proteobacteria bacterium]|nr:DUF262 domain-containing HNH endonuclease family protein [Pseudomonadota bacterium]